MYFIVFEMWFLTFLLFQLIKGILPIFFSQVMSDYQLLIIL